MSRLQERYKKEIAPARTFGFYDDAETLRAMGLAHGADASNTIVLTCPREMK